MRAPGRALTAAWLAAFLLVASPLGTARGAEPLPPPPRLAPALFSEGTDAAVLLVRACVNAPRSDEFLELANAGAADLDLGGWSLSDGEANATFPIGSVLPAGGRLLVVRNATAYAEDTLLAADFTYEDGEARRMEGGVLRLADDGDEVLLLDPGKRVADAYIWGDSPYAGGGWSGRAAERPGRGEVAVRVLRDDGAFADGDRAEDWEGVRRHRLGQSAFELATFEGIGPTTAVLSPDDGDEPLLRFLASARLDIEVAVYTFTSERIASVLAESARRGVRVRVFLDGSPVGGIEDAGHRIVGGLLEADIEVRWLAGASDAVKRYRYLHAKYAVVDGRAAWIGSENFGDAGFSSTREGNRGWSVLVEDPAVAGTLRRIFEADFDPRRRDSVPAVEGTMEPLPVPSPIAAAPPPRPWTARFGRLIAAPDNALDPAGILGIFASARERLSIEAFYFDEDWRGRASPFLEAAFAAARRGVSVRILLDGSWSSVEADGGTNDDALARINARARNESVPLEVRLLEPRGPIHRLHNKGAVVDGNTVFVSSMNWAVGSATENREIGIAIDDPGLAGRFQAAFDADWEGRPASGPGAWRIEDPLVLLGIYVFVAAASAASLRKLRAGRKGISPGAGVRTRASRGADRRGRSGEVRLLPVELVAQPRPRARGGTRARGRRAEARSRVRGPERD